MGYITLKDYDLDLFSGDTFELSLSFKDSYKQQVDLTGASGRMMLRSTVCSSVVEDIEAVISGNIATFSLTPAETAALIGDTLQQYFVYDVEMTTGDGVQTVMSGQLTVTKDVTRD